MTTQGGNGFGYDNRGTPQQERGRDRSRDRDSSHMRSLFQPVIVPQRHTMSTPPRSGMTEAERQATDANFVNTNDRIAHLEHRMLMAEGGAIKSATENAQKFDILFQQSASNHQEWSQKFAASGQHVAGCCELL